MSVPVLELLQASAYRDAQGFLLPFLRENEMIFSCSFMYPAGAGVWWDYGIRGPKWGLAWGGKRGHSGRAALGMGCKSSEELEMFGETGISQN